MARNRFAFIFSVEMKPPFGYEFFFEGQEEAVADLASRIDEDPEEALVILPDLERRFGVHDIHMDPDRDVVAFDTYEVSFDDALPLVQIWRHYFISLGFSVSEITKV